MKAESCIAQDSYLLFCLKRGYNGYVKSNKIIFLAFFSNVLIFAIQIGVALFSHSASIFSESMRALNDVISSLLLVVGIAMSKRKPDILHPFGYGKERFFWTLIAILITIAFTAAISILKGIEQIKHPQLLTFLPLAFIVLLLGLGGNFFMARQEIKSALRFHPNLKKFFRHSPDISLKTTLIGDSLGTIGSGATLLTVILYALTKNTLIDAIGAIVIGIILCVFSLYLLYELRTLLIGKGVSREIEEKILHSVYEVPGVNRVMDLKTMYMGPEEILINLEVHFMDNLSTDDIEHAVDIIKDKIREKVPGARHIQIEAESPHQNKI